MTAIVNLKSSIIAAGGSHQEEANENHFREGIFEEVAENPTGRHHRQPAVAPGLSLELFFQEIPPPPAKPNQFHNEFANPDSVNCRENRAGLPLIPPFALC